MLAHRWVMPPSPQVLSDLPLPSPITQPSPAHATCSASLPSLCHLLWAGWYPSRRYTEVLIFEHRAIADVIIELILEESGSLATVTDVLIRRRQRHEGWGDCHGTRREGNGHVKTEVETEVKMPQAKQHPGWKKKEDTSSQPFYVSHMDSPGDTRALPGAPITGVSLPGIHSFSTHPFHATHVGLMPAPRWQPPTPMPTRDSAVSTTSSTLGPRAQDPKLKQDHTEARPGIF